MELKSWKNVSIPREVTPFKQLLVLKEENDKRYVNVGYMWEVEELISFDSLNLPVDNIHLLGSKVLYTTTKRYVQTQLDPLKGHQQVSTAAHCVHCARV